MKMRLLFSGAILAFGLCLLTACGDDEKKPATLKQKFVAGADAVTFTGAHLYLREEYTVNNSTIREYIITDGTYEDDGWDFEDLTNATYRISVSFAMGQALDFAPGIFFAMNEDLEDFPTANVAHFDFYWEDETTFLTYHSQGENVTSAGSIAVAGGFDDNETMAITFSNITLGGFDATDTQSASFSFEGMVDDRRPL